MKLQAIINAWEERVPKYLAEDWDNVGLQIGSPSSEITSVLTVLDVTEEAVDYAIQMGANLIMSHHPFIFKGIKSINLDSPKGRIFHKAIQHGIAIYSAHTNLDIVSEGLNDVAARKLGLTKLTGLAASSREEYVKLVTFVPQTHEDLVRAALGKAGAGAIGDYSYCSFSTMGTGRFLPLEAANPYLGQVGELASVDEVRIEVILPKRIQNAVIQSMLVVHPYEEVAYEVYPLDVPYKTHSLGRMGVWEKPRTLAETVDIVQKAFPKAHIRLAGARKDVIQKVGICTGSAASLMKEAKRQGADVYITGDVKYHDAQEAKELGLLLMDATHFGTEEMARDVIIDLLREALGEKAGDIRMEAYTDAQDFFLALP